MLDNPYSLEDTDTPPIKTGWEGKIYLETLYFLSRVIENVAFRLVWNKGGNF